MLYALLPVIISQLQILVLVVKRSDKVKVKATRRHACAGTEGRRKYNSNTFAPSALKMGGWSEQSLSRFTPDKDSVLAPNDNRRKCLAIYYCIVLTIIPHVPAMLIRNFPNSSQQTLIRGSQFVRDLLRETLSYMLWLSRVRREAVDTKARRLAGWAMSINVK